jgi:hypothetical protein
VPQASERNGKLAFAAGVMIPAHGRAVLLSRFETELAAG